MATDQKIDAIADGVFDALRGYIDRRLDMLLASNRDLMARAEKQSMEIEFLQTRIDLLEARLEQVPQLRAVR